MVLARCWPDDRYVMKLVKNFDEEFKNMASGMNMRPTTREEVRTHLESFGLIGDVIDNKVRRLSGGQVRAVLHRGGFSLALGISCSLLMTH